MSSEYEESLLDFNLDFLQQTSKTSAESDQTKKCRKAVKLTKLKIISVDSLMKKYFEAKAEIEQLEKVLYSAKEECKKACIDFRNISEKFTQQENEFQCFRISYQQIKEKFSNAENLYSASQSNANQLQILVKQLETVIEGLKVEIKLEKANNKDYEKKVSSLKNENDTVMKHMCLMKEIIFGKRNLNKHYKAILQKYDKGYESDDYDSLLGGMDSDEEIELDSNFKSPLLPKETNKEKVDISSLQISTKTNASKQELIVIKDDNDLDSDFSNEHASADTGRGSSLAFSDGEKCLHSPDYFMDRSPTNAEHADKIRRDRVDVATSPIAFYQFVNTATSPIPAKQAVHIATSPMISHKAKEITVISEPKKNTKGVIHHVSSQCNFLQNVVELQATDGDNELVNRSTNSMVFDKNPINANKRNTINKNKSNLSSTETNNLLTYNNDIHDLIRVTSPIQLENEILSSDNHSISCDIIDERECLELNNSDTFNSTNNKDGEIEMILSKMRFNRDLITPIPTSPFKSHNFSCSMQNQEYLCKDALKVAKICDASFNSLINRLKNNFPEMFKDSEDDPIIIPENENENENDIENFKHEINSYDILKSSSDIIHEDEGEVQHALSISPKCDFNKSIKRLQFEEPLPPILNEATILDKSVDKYANQENTDEEECYEEDIFHVGNLNNNMQSKKRQKPRKLTKLDRFKQKLIPKNKIKPISSQKPKLRMKHLMLSKTKVGASMAAAALNNKSAYEKAVKIMSELKTQQKSKESKLFTLKKRDKQICKEASKIHTALRKVKSPATKKTKNVEGTTTVDISGEHTLANVNSSATSHVLDMQVAKNTKNTSSLEHLYKTQEQQITEEKNDKIKILENILITGLKTCSDISKVQEKSKLVKPSNTSKNKLPSDLNKDVVALTNSPEVKVIQKEDLFGLSPPHENFIKKTGTENKSLITDAIDPPLLGINKTVGTLLTANCLDKVKNTKSVNQKENKTDIALSKLQQKRELRNSKEINLIACSKTDAIEINKELVIPVAKTPSKLQQKRELRNSTEINLIACSKTDAIGISKELVIPVAKTPSKLQQKRELRNSKELNLISCSKVNAIEINKELAIPVAKTPSKMQQKRELRNSKETLISNTKKDFIEMSKVIINVVKCDEPSMSPSPKKLIATRSITKGICNLSATFDELKEVKSSATETTKPEFIQQKDISKNEDKNMTRVQGTRKRQKIMFLDKPDVECKRMLRSSTLRRTSIQENAKEVSSNTGDILLRTELAIKSDDVKEKLQVINLKTEIDQKVQQKTVSYSDIDLFNDSTESNQQIEINKTNGAHPKESILCVMLEKYGRQTVKNFSKKIPESVVNTICKTIGNEISEITKLSPRDYKYSMNQFVDTVKKWNFKQFMAGLMQYLKDPQRKIELYSKEYSPPAPPMTNSEQILLFLVIQLRQAWPTLDVLESVLCNIEYVLFKLNRTPEFDTVESMSHFYAILCRYFKLKSRLRLFMLDAMYCIQFKSVPLIKQCMEVWMHVLPLAHMGIAKSPMVTCMVYLLHFYKCDDKFKRVQEIRYLLNSKYFYEITEWNETKIIEMFKNAIKDVKAIPVEMKLLRMALIVIAKRHGPKWCQKNIIKNILLPMIENDGYSERVKVFCVSMLGPLLKPYPVDMRVHCEIVMNMLLDMLHQNITPQMEEAIYTSLIFMSRHNYNRVIQTLLTWKPRQMSPHLENVMRDFVSEKPLRAWKTILLKISLA